MSLWAAIRAAIKVQRIKGDVKAAGKGKLLGRIGRRVATRGVLRRLPWR